MKNLISYPIWALMLVIVLHGTGCSHKEEDVKPSKISPSAPIPEVPLETMIDFLTSRMHIKKELITYNSKESFFVIDGDMLIDKEEAKKQYWKEKEKGTRTEQWRDPFLVSSLYSHNIKVYINASVPVDWKTAVREAIKKWNLVTGIRINISEVSTAASADITISTFYNNLATTVAWANLPLSTGKPGGHISINTHFNSLSSSVKLFTIVHELGHTLGLWHTNQNYGIFINGTPVSDPESVMNSSVLPWAGFTNGDYTAIRMLYAGAAWRKLTGGARDIGVGADGTVWAIGTSWTGEGGYNILKWNGSSWTAIPGAAGRLDVDPAGKAWVVTVTGSIFRYTGSNWELMPGRARDIGVGADGTVWVIGWNDDPNVNTSIFRWNGSGWTAIPGAAVRIDVDPAGKAWVATANGSIFRYTGSNWELMPGGARDIGISSNANGTVYVTGLDYNSVWQWNGSGWVPLPGGGANVTGDPQGNPWTTDLFGGIYRFD